MDSRMRRDESMPPAFNREPDDYVEVFLQAGAENTGRWVSPYRAYADTLLTVLEFRC